ncbi:Wzz/FepE/Etk N-terminal domain-containing protein [Pseudomonas borbori]|uniref:LPS O-antigen chain length determinant protein, WzzB/FepE family n=1 Tax=Pseudomonas borbori TaxID=289003 RepID=A0A1I5K3V7_9PSED|nr:Wzz/FepE/Etk N-terminal domain-containing protein [Pseudomonas borbori]SFO79735.1 LPS O-antigen chain length determinant protein, WzzB/FepE family [Pseudomonas borbori]
MNAISPAIQQTSSDEIDLAALFRALWEQKLLIVLVTVLGGMLAAAYAFQVTPVYQVQSVLRPAAIKDLDALNRTGVYKLAPAQAMKRVGATVESYDTRLEFFRANQGLFEALRQPNRSLEQTFERFNQEAFKMLLPDPKKADNLSAYVGVQLTYPQGVDGVALVNGLVEYSVQIERERIAADLAVVIQNRLNQLDAQMAAARASYEASKDAKIAKLQEADSLKRANLQDELKALRQQLKTRRDNRVAQLDEAVRIAKALGISKPATPSSLGEAERVAQGNVIRTEVNNQQIPLYFMGSEALEAERNALLQRRSDDFTEPRIAQIAKELQLLANNRQIEMLNKRESEDLFLKDLASWRGEAARLRNLNVDVSSLKLVSIDQVALEPLRPIKPKKALILALGLVLGGVLGLFIALLRNMLRRTPSRNHSSQLNVAA